MVCLLQHSQQAFCNFPHWMINQGVHKLISKLCAQLLKEKKNCNLVVTPEIKFLGHSFFHEKQFIRIRQLDFIRFWGLVLEFVPKAYSILPKLHVALGFITRLFRIKTIYPAMRETSRKLEEDVFRWANRYLQSDHNLYATVCAYHSSRIPILL